MYAPSIDDCYAFMGGYKSEHPGGASIALGDGSYALKSMGGRDGVAPGEYGVSVLSYTGTFADGTAEYLVPERFRSPVTSGLTATIASDADSPLELDFELQD